MYGQTESLKAVHAREKDNFLCRMSVFEGNAEVTSKLFKKETKTFTALSEKAQKKKKSLEERSHNQNDNKLESPRKIK